MKFGSEKCGSIQKYPKVDELMIHHRFGSKNLMSILMDHFFMERQEGDMCVCVFFVADVQKHPFGGQVLFNFRRSYKMQDPCGKDEEDIQLFM